MVKLPKGRAGRDEWAELWACVSLPSHDNVVRFLGLAVGLDADDRFSEAKQVVTAHARRGAMGFVFEYASGGCLAHVLRTCARDDASRAALFGDTPSSFKITCLRMALDIAR